MEDALISTLPTPTATPRRRSAVQRMKRELESIIEATAAANTPLHDLSNAGNTPSSRSDGTAKHAATPAEYATAASESCTLYSPSLHGAHLPDSSPSSVPENSRRSDVGATRASRPEWQEEPPDPSAAMEPTSPAALPPMTECIEHARASELLAVAARTLATASEQLSAAHVAATAVTAAPTLKDSERLSALERRLSVLVADINALQQDREHAVAPATVPGGPSSTPAVPQSPTPREPVSATGKSPAASPPTPSYGATGVAASRLQSHWRGRVARRHASAFGADEPHVRADDAMRRPLPPDNATGPRISRGVQEVMARGRAAHALLASERRYAERLRMLALHIFVPLQREGHLTSQLGGLFANLQVLTNLSRMLIAQLCAAASTPVAPSAAAVTTLLHLLPSYKVYATYVAGLTSAQQSIAILRAADPAVGQLVSLAEEASGSSVGDLLLAPARRLPDYGTHVERMLELTPLQAAERSQFCRALGAVHELCALVDDSLADHRSRARVNEIAERLTAAAGEKAHPQLADGLAVPHRRFVSEACSPSFLSTPRARARLGMHSSSTTCCLCSRRRSKEAAREAAREATREVAWESVS